MADQQETLQILITAKDEATKVLAALGGKVKDVETGTTNMAKSAEQGGLSIGKMAAAVGLGNLAFSAAQKAVGFVTDTLKESINAAKAEEVAVAKVDTILNTLTKTRTVSTTTTAKYNETVGVSAEKHKELDLAAAKTKLQLEAKTASLTKLSAQLSKGTITQAEYNFKVRQTRVDIAELKNKLDSLHGGYSKTEEKTKSFTKTTELAGFKLSDLKKSVDEAASAAVKMGFDDEDAMISKAKLLQVTNDAKKATDAFQVAMDLARFKGIDLDSATQAVTLALGGNVKMLKQLGVEIPENVKDMDILGEVHNKVAGQAEAFANTSEGAAERYKVTMENLQETIGKAVLPVVTQFFSRVSDFLQSERLTEWITAIRKGFNDYVVPVIRDSLIPAWNNLADALKPIMPYLLDILKFLGIVIGATIIGGIKLLAITFDYVAGSVRGVIESVKSVVEWFQKAFEKVTQFKDATGGAIGGAVNSAGDFFKGLFKAEGGPISAGEPYIVGEKGPEMIIPSSSGTVIPNNKLGKMSGPTINFNGITVRSDNDIQTIVSQVLSALGRRSDLASKGIY